MSTLYFIDYENVSIGGLKGFDKLSKEDVIHIFFTKNNKKIDMSVFAKVKGIINLHEVKEGDESTDKHILAHLGLECGKQSKKVNFVLVSKDKGYDEIIKYLSKETGHKITRQESISGAKIKPSKKEQPKKEKKVVSKTEKKAPGEKRKLIATKIQKLLSKQKIDNKIVNETASIVAKHFEKKDYKNLIHKDLVKKIGEKKAKDIYKRIKKEI